MLFTMQRRQWRLDDMHVYQWRSHRWNNIENICIESGRWFSLQMNWYSKRETNYHISIRVFSWLSNFFKLYIYMYTISKKVDLKWMGAFFFYWYQKIEVYLARSWYKLYGFAVFLFLIDTNRSMLLCCTNSSRSGFVSSAYSITRSIFRREKTWSKTCDNWRNGQIHLIWYFLPINCNCIRCFNRYGIQKFGCFIDKSFDAVDDVKSLFLRKRSSWILYFLLENSYLNEYVIFFLLIAHTTIASVFLTNPLLVLFRWESFQWRKHFGVLFLSLSVDQTALLFFFLSELFEENRVQSLLDSIDYHLNIK